MPRRRHEFVRVAHSEKTNKSHEKNYQLATIGRAKHVFYDVEEYSLAPTSRPTVSRCIVDRISRDELERYRLRPRATARSNNIILTTKG